MKPKEIKALRESLGLTQGQLAKQIGVEWHTVMRWERGRHKPSPLALERLYQLRDSLPKGGK